MSVLVISFPIGYALNFSSICVVFNFHSCCLHSEINPTLGSAQECLNL